jgi:hypothetical protein
MNLTSLLYRIARLMRDANAISRGPSAIGARLVRKALMRRSNSFINSITRLPNGRR